MNKIKIEEFPFSKVDHVGAVVRDLDKAVEYYHSLGIKPFEPSKLTVVERELRGKPIDVDKIKAKISFARIGSIRLELIQPIKGKSPWKEFLESKGEGVHHLGFLVDDIDKETAKLVEKGFVVVYRARFLKGGGAVYFDTGKIGGVLLELVQWPPG